MPELHALDVGVGAVLSQDGSEAPLTLSPAERNYDVGNKQLLAVVLALQE